WSKRYTEERFDLAGPVRLNVAIFTSDAAGSVRRLPWQPDNAQVMDPGTWGVANGAVKVSWAAQPGATSYRLYRAATPNLADARLVETVTRHTQTSDQPGSGTAYYWLTAVDPLGESRFRQGVVQSGVQCDDQLFQVQRFAGSRHGALPPQGPSAVDIGRASTELDMRQALTHP
ncbi:MAG TPA: hypothetical protein VM431_15795, partial [Phycisphaerae bacterium]|nr:hypothetical protein [Phycisphaerae bacterium]